jgi:hypothetical protein
MTKEIVLLLTTTVNVQPHKCYIYQTNKEERIKTYMKAIVQWLEKTNFKIVLVENSGHQFEEITHLLKQYCGRFEFIGFCENELKEAQFLANNNSKGASEIFSINYAFNHSLLLQKADFIIKVTGRYFIPEFQDYLSTFDVFNYDVLTQYDVNSCEIVGCHKKHFNHIFNNDLFDENGQYMGHVEYVYRYKCSLYKNVIRCKPFSIEPTCRGGVNQIHYYL